MDKKNKIVFIVFIAALIGYFVPIFFEASMEVVLESESFQMNTQDNVAISGTIYYPKNFDPNDKYPTLIYSHGLTGNRYSDPVLRYNLINRGFVVVCYDSRGHGFSSGGLGVDLSFTPSQSETADLLRRDVDSVLNFILTKNYVDTNNIGLYGVSLGGGVVAYYSWFDSLRDIPYVKAVVAISFVGQILIDLGANETNPSNYLAIVGEKDEFYTQEEFNGTLKALTGDENAKFNTLYGNLDDDTLREVYIIPGVGHLDSGAHTIVNNETIKWFEKIFFEQISGTELIKRPPIESFFDAYKEFSHYFLKILFVYFVGYAIFSSSNKKENIESLENLRWKLKRNNPFYLYLLASVVGGFAAVGVQFIMPIPKMGAPILFSILICTLILVMMLFKLRNKEFKFSSIISIARKEISQNYKKYIPMIVLSCFCLMSIDILYYLWIGNFIRTINEVVTTLIMGIILFFVYYFNQLFLFRKIKNGNEYSNEINYGASFLSVVGGHLIVCLVLIIVLMLGFSNVMNMFILIPWLFCNTVAVGLSIIIHRQTKSFLLSSLIPAIYMGWYLSVAFPTLIIF